MFNDSLWRQAQRMMQALALYLLVGLALALLAATLMAAVGWLPWPDLVLTFGGAALPMAGMWVQVALTALLLLMCFFLPANARMARLERSHRSFQISMEDVRRAYSTAHAGDRAGVFALSGEFDALRSRMDLLRKHPDLGHLEPELLQLAAQMSFESRELARTYSDERVARAKMFLKQRQEEVQGLSERITLARQTCDALRRWMQDIEADERTSHEQIKRLEADLREILPTLGYDFDEPREANVVSLPKPGK
ncbi:DNA repair protein [Fertoebacter nigrum]|uniref:DNA repair protein n=1 Tax=Fertoeibacter niger TaxID=2656921 RepID=A0A8X8GYN0_9RHOB|nr:DNA repair protein [Fertoeibacter niger]NUB42887.1 DNA repair protein [Fertoeibacter niger]